MELINCDCFKIKLSMCTKLKSLVTQFYFNKVTHRLQNSQSHFSYSAIGSTTISTEAKLYTIVYV